MSAFHIAHDRALLRVTGADRIEFLQGVVSNDVQKADNGAAIWAAFLTPQGKYLHDFFVIGDGESLLLDGEKDRISDLHKRLRRYTLRSDAKVELADDLSVAVVKVAAAPTPENILAYPDPRLEAAGERYIGKEIALSVGLRNIGLSETSPEDWDAHRLALGLPDGSRDFCVERSTLAEGNADLLGAVDWQKGCWMGQEVTARMHYRGLAKRRMVPMTIDGPAPPPGAPVMMGDREIGECRSSAGDKVMTIVKIAEILTTLDVGQQEPLVSGNTKLRPAPPAWLTAALAGDEAASQSA